MKEVKDIVVTLKKEDGSVKKYTRPATSVLELEKFQDMQNEITSNIPKIDPKDPDFQKKYADIDWAQIKRKNQNRQIEFIVELFKPYDAFTVEEFKQGTPSFVFVDTLTNIFKQISPEDFAENEDKPRKKSPSKNGKKG